MNELILNDAFSVLLSLLQMMFCMIDGIESSVCIKAHAAILSIKKKAILSICL